MFSEKYSEELSKPMLPLLCLWAFDSQTDGKTSHEGDDYGHTQQDVHVKGHVSGPESLINYESK